MKSIIDNGIFIAKTLQIISWAWFQYKMNLRSKLSCIKYVASELSAINPLYIKILQSLATNGALFSIQEREYLVQYTDDVPYDSKNLDESFREHLPTTEIICGAVPIKAGTVAVVYEGELVADPPKKIVVKVLRKNIQQDLLKALSEIETLLRCINWIPVTKAMNIVSIIEENRTALLSQTNFKQEIENIERMQEQCKHTDYVKIPKVYKKYTESCPEMIVMEYIEGKRIEDVSTASTEIYSKLLAQFQIKTTLFNRFYHGDLHSGNIIFIGDNDNSTDNDKGTDNDNSKNSDDDIAKYKLGIIDFGLMGEASQHEQEVIYNLLKSLENKINNGYDTSVLVLDSLTEPAHIVKTMSPKDRKIIINALQKVVEEAIYGENGLQSEHLYGINKCLIKYKLCLARFFCKMHMAMMAIDSVTHRLNSRQSHLQNLRMASDEIFSQNDILNI